VLSQVQAEHGQGSRANNLNFREIKAVQVRAAAALGLVPIQE